MKKIILALSVLSSSLFAAEADNFTAYSLNLTDVRQDINQLANTYLSQAVTDLNEKMNCNESKSEEALYNELRLYFANHSKGKLVKEILYTDTFAKNALPLKESVYGGWTINNGFLLGRKKAASSPLALSPLIKFGDETIGVDKLEHMFGMGFSYFTKYHKKGKSIKSVLKTGVLYEKTILGGNVLATGVFSYADLSANFNGMRFWNHVLQKQDDILGREFNRGPLVTCVDNKWKLSDVHTIDFSNYVDPSFDESINCSKFANKSGAEKFKTAINNLGFSGCPLDTKKVKALKDKYAPSGISQFIINDEGLGTVSYLNEF